MKSIIIVLCAGFIFGALGYFLGNKKDSTQNIKTAQTPSTARLERSNRPSNRDTANIRSNILNSLNRSNSRSLLKSSMDIFQLNAQEIKELLKEPQFTNINYMGGANTQLYSACFARLAEIDPASAFEFAQTLDQQKQYLAINAITQEWSVKDADTALNAILELKDPQLKQISLMISLQSIANDNPEYAIKLANEHSTNDWIKTAIISQWAQSDPLAATSYAESIENKDEKNKVMLGIIAATAQQDPDKAFTLLNETDISYSDGIHQIIHHLAQSNPEKTISWINNSYTGDNKETILLNTISTWMKQDESAAFAYYESIESRQLKQKIGEGLLSQLSRTNPKKYFELYPTMGSKNQNDWSYKQALSELAKTDIQSAQDYIESLTNPALKKDSLIAMFKGITESDPDKAIEIANALQNPLEKEIALAEVYENIAEKDPLKVAEAFLDRNLKNIGDYELDDFVYDYARKDLNAAKLFVEGIDDPLKRDDSVQRLLSRWSEEDPVNAALYAFEQESTKGIESAMWSIGRKLAETDPEKGIEIALAQTKNSISEKMLRTVLDKWADKDLEAALEAVNTIPADWVGTSIYKNVASQYANTDLEKGISWIDSIQDTKAKNSATYTFVSNWATNDPDAATEHVNQLPKGDQRDSAVRSLVYAFDDAEPSYALEWADTISNKGTRYRTMQYTYNQWKKRDPQKANQWLDSNNLIHQDTKDKWR